MMKTDNKDLIDFTYASMFNGKPMQRTVIMVDPNNDQNVIVAAGGAVYAVSAAVVRAIKTINEKTDEEKLPHAHGNTKT